MRRCSAMARRRALRWAASSTGVTSDPGCTSRARARMSAVVPGRASWLKQNAFRGVIWEIEGACCWRALPARRAGRGCGGGGSGNPVGGASPSPSLRSSCTPLGAGGGPASPHAAAPAARAASASAAASARSRSRQVGRVSPHRSICRGGSSGAIGRSAPAAPPSRTRSLTLRWQAPWRKTWADHGRTALLACCEVMVFR
jgi:hypothetical protein